MATTTNNGWTTPNDSDPFKNGALAIRTLGSAIDTSTGNGLIAWTTYTPTLSNVTLGTGGTSTFKYCQLGKNIFIRGSISVGTGGTVTSAVNFTLPIASSLPFVQPMGTAQLYNGTSVYPAPCISINSSTCGVYIVNTAGTYNVLENLGPTVPFSWTTGATRQMLISVMYEGV